MAPKKKVKVNPSQPRAKAKGVLRLFLEKEFNVKLEELTEDQVVINGYVFLDLITNSYQINETMLKILSSRKLESNYVNKKLLNSCVRRLATKLKKLRLHVHSDAHLATFKNLCNNQFAPSLRFENKGNIGQSPTEITSGTTDEAIAGTSAEATTWTYTGTTVEATTGTTDEAVAGNSAEATAWTYAETTVEATALTIGTSSRDTPEIANPMESFSPKKTRYRDLKALVKAQNQKLSVYRKHIASQRSQIRNLKHQLQRRSGKNLNEAILRRNVRITKLMKEVTSLRTMKRNQVRRTLYKNKSQLAELEANKKERQAELEANKKERQQLRSEIAEIENPVGQLADAQIKETNTGTPLHFK